MNKNHYFPSKSWNMARRNQTLNSWTCQLCSHVSCYFTFGGQAVLIRRALRKLEAPPRKESRRKCDAERAPSWCFQRRILHVLVVASVGWSWCLCFFVQSEVFHSRLTGCRCCTARQLDSRRGGTGLRHASFLLNQSKPHMLQICFVESEMRQTWEILRVWTQHASE